MIRPHPGLLIYFLILLSRPTNYKTTSIFLSSFPSPRLYPSVPLLRQHSLHHLITALLSSSLLSCPSIEPSHIPQAASDIADFPQHGCHCFIKYNFTCNILLSYIILKLSITPIWLSPVKADAKSKQSMSHKTWSQEGLDTTLPEGGPQWLGVGWGRSALLFSQRLYYSQLFQVLFIWI